MFKRATIKTTLIAIGASLIGLFAIAPPAVANMLFWLDPDNGQVMNMPLDGSAAPSALGIAPAEVTYDFQLNVPGSLDYDPETGRLYWPNSGSPANISWAAADGSGGGVLGTVSDPLNSPLGLSLDGASDRLFVLGGDGYSVGTFSLDAVQGTWALNDDNFRGGPLVDAQGGTLWLAGSEWVSYGALDGSGSLDTYMPSAFISAGLSVDRDAGRL